MINLQLFFAINWLTRRYYKFFLKFKYQMM